MFGFEKHIGFVKSLISDKAGQFSEMITRNLFKTKEMAEMAISKPGEVLENAVRQVPDMILPEDTGSVSEQILDDSMEIVPESGSRAAPGQIRDDVPGVSSLTRDMPRTKTDLAGRAKHGEIFPTREIMRKKLNHFQIERLAQKIKERLESEIKVEKERRGEEP